MLQIKKNLLYNNRNPAKRGGKKPTVEMTDEFELRWFHVINMLVRLSTQQTKWKIGSHIFPLVIHSGEPTTKRMFAWWFQQYCIDVNVKWTSNNMFLIQSSSITGNIIEWNESNWAAISGVTAAGRHGVNESIDFPDAYHMSLQSLQHLRSIFVFVLAMKVFVSLIFQKHTSISNK